MTSLRRYPWTFNQAAPLSGTRSILKRAAPIGGRITLAALVMVQQLFGESPAGMPHQLKLRTGSSLSIPPARAKVLQQSAAEANEAFGRVPK